MDKGKKTFRAGAVAVISFCLLLFCSIVILKGPIQIAMLLGCGTAGIISWLGGSSWKDIERGITAGIAQSLIALVILLLIGVLAGVWIDTGTIPALIYYGLKIIRPGVFLASAMVICSVLSITLGSWGAAGAVGLALMGIAKAMGLPAPIAAGAIISGAYFGDKVSPLSDTTNLAATVAGVDVFDHVRHMFPVVGTAYAISFALYLIIGAGYAAAGQPQTDLRQLADLLGSVFSITPVATLPFFVLAACILFKAPPIPSIAAGTISAVGVGLVFRGNTAAGLFKSAYSGYISCSGNDVIDQIFTAGGMSPMMSSVSLIMCAMMFGGIMEHTGLMEAFMEPARARVDSARRLITVSVLSCAVINLIIPEQYIAISLPGHMFGKEYERLGVDRLELARGLGAGGAATSALVPWNTCGIFMCGILGVSAVEYGRYAFLNIIVPVLTVTLQYFPAKHKKT